ncbi:aldo/keto reductase [Frondihabitans cladoniiphilus]|uniref:Aldo/keto reductase n=1 Tax=Frondihabitans cladoniiphilus TaxID=715785 RepID=A0ABP8W856_9MICO
MTRVGYGAMQLDRLHRDRAAAVKVVRRAVELGVDHIDTAQFYGTGFSNEVIREALGATDDVVIVSKVGRDPDAPGLNPIRLAQRPEQLRASVLQNLDALGLDCIPVVNLRRLDVGRFTGAPSDQIVDVDDQLAEMVAMRDEGLIGAIGLSTVTADILCQAIPAGIVCVQNAYSLTDRVDEALVELCRAEGIAWVPYFPLGGAFAGARKVTDEPTVQATAAELGVTAAQVGLAWLLRHSPNTLLIPGTSSIEHLEANMAAGSVTLTDEMMGQLQAVSS